MPDYLGLGVIEGFFGPPWSWKARTDCAQFLAATGYRFYLFAPKRCETLRRQWTAPWPVDEWQSLVRLRAHYCAHRVKFGVGLSPYALYRDFDRESQAQLVAKIEWLNQLDLDLLGIFFDDMPAAVPRLAWWQAEIVARVREVSNATALMVCPTYYSDDPILDRVSGPRPDDYLQALGSRLDPDVHVFWTGPQVCSQSISLEHLEATRERLGRPVAIWDNYPVNDGPRMSRHLHLRGFTGRDQVPDASTTAHAVNPMNQAYLSRIPLDTLARLYTAPDRYDAMAAFHAALAQHCDLETAAALGGDLESFQDTGLDALTRSERLDLGRRYGALDNPYAEEIIGWMREDFGPTPADLEEFATL